MVEGGLKADGSAQEVQTANHGPLVLDPDVLRSRLAKRDWLLAVYRKGSRLHPNSGSIEQRHRLSRDELLREYYTTGRPVIITGMMDDWPAMKKWSLDYFAANFGDREIELQVGRSAGVNYEIEHEKYVGRMRFAELVARIRASRATNDFYVTAQNSFANRRGHSGALGRYPAGPRVPYARGAGRILVDRPGRHDHAVSPRPQQHSFGDRLSRSTGWAHRKCWSL